MVSGFIVIVAVCSLYNAFIAVGSFYAVQSPKFPR